MEDEKDLSGGDNEKMKFQRQIKGFELSQRGDYKTGYTSDDFFVDLVKYFDGEVDFNSDKIRQEIEMPQKLTHLIDKAIENNTHPVVEFVKKIFKDLAS